jgi:hypothetical protein
MENYAVIIKNKGESRGKKERYKKELYTQMCI